MLARLNQLNGWVKIDHAMHDHAYYICMRIRNELYGAYDAATMMEWTDGVLSSIMRRMCQDDHCISYYPRVAPQIRSNSQSQKDNDLYSMFF